jgi:hypothetical protein
MRGGTGQGMGAGGDIGRSSDDELSFLKSQTEELRRQIEVIESKIKNPKKG